MEPVGDLSEQMKWNETKAARSSRYIYIDGSFQLLETTLHNIWPKVNGLVTLRAVRAAGCGELVIVLLLCTRKQRGSPHSV